MQLKLIMDNCPFCQIIARKLPAEVLFEDNQAIVIKDLHPAAPVHILIIPKEHISSLNEVQPEQAALLADLLLLGRRMAHELGIGEGFRTVINTGPQAGQSVFHLHVHILGGAPLGVDLLTRGMK